MRPRLLLGRAPWFALRSLRLFRFINDKDSEDDDSDEGQSIEAAAAAVCSISMRCRCWCSTAEKSIFSTNEVLPCRCCRCWCCCCCCCWSWITSELDGEEGMEKGTRPLSSDEADDCNTVVVAEGVAPRNVDMLRRESTESDRIGV